MDKSITLDKNIVEQAVHEAVATVRSWTLRELQSLLSKNNKKLIIIPIGDHGYIVGNHALKIHKNECRVIYRYSDQELVFSNGTIAMVYAITQFYKKYELAEEIHQRDQRLYNLSTEINFFTTKLAKAKKQKNSFKTDIYASRLSQAQAQLMYNRGLLEKRLNLAKYINH